MNSKNKDCYIFAAGEYDSKDIALLSQKDFSGITVIAADAGLKACRSMGIKPDYILGDFDSMEQLPEEFEATESIVKYPTQKDDTDTGIAVELALEKGCDRIMIYGGLGGRLDHTFANIQTLAKISSQNAMGFLLSSDNKITVVKEGKTIFPNDYSGYLSVFSLSEKSEISLSGVKYPLDHKVIYNDFPLGVSNEFTNDNAIINVTKGRVALFWQYNDQKALPSFSDYL